MTLSLYLLSRRDAVGYDECDAFVVAAPDEARARSTPFIAWADPDPNVWGCGDECRHVHPYMADHLGPQTPCAWEDRARTTCTLIAVVAAPDVVRGVVLRSFAAG